MQAIIYKADTPNVNGIVFSKAVLEGVVANNQPIPVVVDSYPSPLDSGKAIAFAYLKMDGDDVIASFEMLDSSYLTKVASEWINKRQGLLMPKGLGMWSTTQPDAPNKSFDLVDVCSLTIVHKDAVNIGAAAIDASMFVISPG